MLFICTVASLVGTTLWAVDLAANPVDIRIPLLFGGFISAMSLAFVPLSGEMPSVYLTARLGLLLYAYQHALSIAFKLGGAEIQAIVNCNVVLICLTKVFSGHIPFTPLLGALAFATCIFSGALVLHMARERKIVVPSQNSADEVPTLDTIAAFSP